ncbi:hypothetical protein SUDANB146_00239 [Streptomyces sp. enrichment culture]
MTRSLVHVHTVSIHGESDRRVSNHSPTPAEYAGRRQSFEALLRRLRGDRSEEDFLRHGERIGPCLTCLCGVAFEQENRDWCLRTVAVLEERRRSRARN